MKNKSRVSIFLLLLVCAIFSCSGLAYAAKDRTLDYVPQNQEMDMVTYSTPVRLDEISCSDEYTQKVALLNRCFACMTVKGQCPDCCLDVRDGTGAVKTSDRKHKCQDEEEDLAAVTKPFDENTCTAVNSCVANLDKSNYATFSVHCTGATLPQCQKLGCPSGVVAGAINSDCINTGRMSGTLPVYICKRNKEPEFTSLGTGCVKNGTDDEYYVDNTVFTELPEADKLKCEDYFSGEVGMCSTYTLNTDQVGTNVAACTAAAGAYEIVEKPRDCCWYDETVCQNSAAPTTGLYGDHPGYQYNCSSNETACQKRVDWAECKDSSQLNYCCDNLTPGTCTQLTADVADIVDGLADGSDNNCFQNTANDFYYDFVAKSNENIMVIWQMQTTPKYYQCSDPASCPNIAEITAANEWNTGDAPNTYFYTLVKMYNITNSTTEDSSHETYPGLGNPSVIYQKDFVNAFTTFAAIATDKDTFLQGNKYRIRLRYLLAPLSDYVLKSDVTQMQLIVVRARE